MNRNHIIKDINLILEKYNISERITIKDILLTENGLIDSFTENGKFSNIIINYIWPPNKTQERTRLLCESLSFYLIN